MDKLGSWEKFTSTGAVSDYLSYVKSCREQSDKGAAENLAAGEKQRDGERPSKGEAF